MITKKFPFHREADFDSLSRKVSAWADRKQFGISHSFNRTSCILSVDFWQTDEDGPDHGGSPRQIEIACASLERIIARCAPRPRQTLPNVPPTSRMPNPKYGKGARVRAVHGTGTVIARFEDVGDYWTYVVHMDEMFCSPVHGAGGWINRAVFTESFLDPAS